MKKLCVLLFTVIFSAELFCQIRVGLLNGPSCIPSAYMMENIYAIDGNEIEYNKYPDAMSVVPKLLKNEVDVTFLPPNVAAKLYNSSGKAVICVAITGDGNLSVITKNNSIFTLKDLKGKKVYVAGQGATPEYMMKYLLEKQSLSESVELDFSIPTAQLAGQLISGKIEYALVPEPFATVAMAKDKAVIRAVELEKEFAAVEGTNKIYPMTVMVVRRKFFEENSELVSKYIAAYKESVEWTILAPGMAGKYCEKYDLGLAANIVTASIPHANYVFLSSAEGKNEIENILKMFFTYDESSIGGKMPDEDFYLQ